MKAKLVFSITSSRPTRIGKTFPLLTSGWITAKSPLCPQLPSLTRSGHKRGDATQGSAEESIGADGLVLAPVVQDVLSDLHVVDGYSGLIITSYDQVLLFCLIVHLYSPDR